MDPTTHQNSDSNAEIPSVLPKPAMQETTSGNQRASSNGVNRGTDSVRAGSTDPGRKQNGNSHENDVVDELPATADYQPEDPALAKTGVWNCQGEALYEGSGIDFSQLEFPNFAPTGEDTPTEIAINVAKKGRSFTLTDRKILDAFDHIAYVAHGSFGVVCKGTDQLGREVAIKILTSESKEVRERFHNEALITAQLGAAEPSDRIIKVYERGELEIIDEDGVTRSVPYASMEFIDETLGERIQELHRQRRNGNKTDGPAKSLLSGE